MAVVVDLDALGRAVQAEDLGDLFEEFPLAAALGEAPGQGLARVVQGVVDQLALGAPLRPAEFHLVFRPEGQRPGDERLLLRSEEHTSELQSLMRISYAV